MNELLFFFFISKYVNELGKGMVEDLSNFPKFFCSFCYAEIGRST